METDDPLEVLKAGLPLMGVGAITVILTFCFCCYLRRLRRQGEQELGYRRVRYKKRKESEPCPVCLEEFESGDKLAECTCRHHFHLKCLRQWLSEHNTCPMCKARLGLEAQENTRLVVAPDPRPRDPPTPEMLTADSV